MRNLVKLPVGPRRTQSEDSSPQQQLTYTVEEAAAILRISRAHAYACVACGDIPSVRLGRRIVVPARALDAMLHGDGMDTPTERHGRTDRSTA
jgi:excisionase family DNA binding protein